MKKILAFLIAVMMMVSFISCGPFGKKDDDKDEDNNGSNSNQDIGNGETEDEDGFEGPIIDWDLNS